MTDYKLEYWIEAVHDALESIGKLDAFSNKDIQDIASSMKTSADCQDMAFGQDNITPPSDSEVVELKRTHQKELDEMHRREDVYRDNLAKKNRVPPQDVAVTKHGRIEIDTRHQW